MFVLHVGLLALIHPLAEPSLPAHPRYRATDTPAGDAIASETIYAMHKPRGVVSAVRDPDPYRRTLTDVMVAAGVPPLTAHVGRLDAETSGLLLLTSHPLLLRAIIGRLEAGAGIAVGAANPPPRSSTSAPPSKDGPGIAWMGL